MYICGKRYKDRTEKVTEVKVYSNLPEVTLYVDGKELESYMADVDTDADYEGDHEAISDGYFHESAEGFRSAPYFDVQIDDISLLDTAF